MFAQLGNVKFQQLKGFDSWANGGGDAVYAEHEIINGKARLQKTGDGLKEISFSIKLNANFCNPSKELAVLEASKSSGEIMAFLLGDGTYIGDFVITSTANTIDEAFANGTPIQITVSLVIKEFIAFSKLELQQQAARNKAFAVGNKASVIKPLPQPLTPLAMAAQMVTRTNEHANIINTLTSQYQNNVSEREAIQSNIGTACDKVNKHLDDLNNKLQTEDDLKDKFNSLGDAANDVKAKVSAVKSSIQDPENIRNLNTVLQGSVSNFKTAAVPLQTSVITRKII